MGIRKQPAPVKLIVGFIFSQESIYQRAKELVKKRFGAIDFQSPSLSFTHTDYYQKEFGDNLLRRFISFKRLISPDQLAAIKIFTNRIEARLGRLEVRQVNIDPGYLTLAKLVLASTKDFYHRIYIGKGIFAETTLVYQHKAFKDFDWTYPDYKTKEYHEIFKNIRDRYAASGKMKSR